MKKLQTNGPRRELNVMKHRHVVTVSLLAVLSVFVFTASVYSGDSTEQVLARQIINATGVKGGLIVHLGCGDGKLTAATHVNSSYIVQGLDTDTRRIDQARKCFQLLGLNGKVTAREFDGANLPYIDNMVNLLVVSAPFSVRHSELTRVLAPRGVAYIKEGKKWRKTIKPVPDDIDEWTHYLYDSSNNAVSHDLIVGPPRRSQWIGGPKWSRSHEHMSSVNAMVSAGGKIFYVMDEGPRSSISLPAKWSLIARDAFNGVILWKRSLPSWHVHLWPLKSGPAQIQRRLVAKGNTLYTSLGAGAPLSVLDAESGRIIRTFDGTKGVEEVIVSEGVIFLLLGDTVAQQQEYNHQISHVWNAGDKAKSKYAWDDRMRTIMAIDEKTSNVLWRQEYPVVHITMAIDGKRVYFYDGSKIISLDRKEGKQAWNSESIAVNAFELGTAFTPTLVLYRNVVLFSGGDKKLTAIETEKGEILWTSEHPESGHHSPGDVLCIDGLIWSGAIARVNKQGGKFTGRDPLTGAVKIEFPLDVDVSWFHHRCHRSKATDRFIMSGATGTEFIDFRSKHWTIHHWARGACLYGIMPANGMIYVPPSPCACFIESKMHGFNALAPARAKGKVSSGDTQLAGITRLEKGPAYGQRIPGSSSTTADSWPTYRHDAQRSGYTKSSVPTYLEKTWQTELGGKLTPAVVAEGKVFVAAVNDHSVHALDENSGKKLWSYMTAGRIDSPPTIWRGRVLFGSTDGWLYCLAASDGELIWRFHAAAEDKQMMVCQQLESVWPVHGSVLVVNDRIYCLAGRSIFLDGGMRLYQLDPKTGSKLSESVWNDRDPQSGENMQKHVKGMTMPTALSDILSSDGKHLYMRSQQIGLDGSRSFEKIVIKNEDAESAHLFAATGFLDDNWFHRSLWIYGIESGSGWGGWSKPGLTVPVGRILSVGDSAVYGFGRKPAFFCQSSVMEYQLYSANPEFSRDYFQSVRKVTKEGQRNIADWQVNYRLPVDKLTILDYNWRVENLPLLGRAMVLADNTLFVAGPPDVVDETEAFGRFGESEVYAKLVEQAAAFEGEKGGLLWAVSAEDGKKLAEHKLDSPPVFDGMVAANGKLYLVTMDGNVICMKKK